MGAGASYEVGMPLVREFTQTLRKNILNRIDTNLFSFDSDHDLKNKFIELLKNENLNYEDVVGELEKMYLNASDNRQRIHGVISQLIECIQLLLLEDQKNTLKLLAEKNKRLLWNTSTCGKREGNQCFLSKSRHSF